MRRFEALQALAGLLTDQLVVTNLANTATEWHAVRPSDANLYAVGMGMVTPCALGVALAQPACAVLALDGDGGLLFDPSVLGVAARAGAANLCVLVFDNGGYVSCGPLPVVASFSGQGVDLAVLALAYGVQDVQTVADVAGLCQAFCAPPRLLDGRAGPRVIIAKVDAAQAFVGALPMDLKESKYRFVRHIEQRSGRRTIKPSAKEHGAPAEADPHTVPVGADTGFGQVLHQALRDNGVNIVVGLPCSGFSAAQARLMKDPQIRYLAVPHEGTGLGICAGAWLGGLRPAALIENFGLMASVYQLLRGHLSFGIPTLILTEYRGDTGDAEFFAEAGELTPGLLQAMRINHRQVAELAALGPAVRDAWRWMDACLRPFALLPSFELTRHRT